jgi:hypothetical protein
MAVRQGFETLDFNPTPVDQLLAPIKMKADTNALYGNILSSIQDIGDYLTPAEDDTRQEYENRIGSKVKDLSSRLLTNKGVGDMEIDELRQARAEYQQFFSPGGIGYQRMMDKKNYQSLQKSILENKDISGDTKRDWLNLAMLNYKNNYKNGYDFSDIVPSKEVDLAKLALDTASKIEKFEASVKRGASPAEIRQMAIAYDIPENSAAFQVLTETTQRSPEKIRAVLIDYFNSDPEVQAMYRQNNLLRQVNPNRMSNEEMQERAFRSAINATSINNYKRSEDFKFLPKYIYSGGNSDGIVVGDTMINRFNTGELKKGFWGRIGNVFSGKDYSALKTKDEFRDEIYNDLLKEFKSILPSTKHTLESPYSSGLGAISSNIKDLSRNDITEIVSSNEFNTVLDEYQEKLGFNDIIREEIVDALSNGKTLSDIPELNGFIDNLYDKKGNVEMTGIAITGKQSELKDTYNNIFLDPGKRKVTITADGKDATEDIDIQEALNQPGSAILNSQFIPAMNKFQINFVAKDKKGNTKKFTAMVAPTPDELNRITGGRVIRTGKDKFGFVDVASNGNRLIIENNGLDQNGRATFSITEIDPNGREIDNYYIDSTNPRYYDFEDMATKLNSEVIRQIFNK